MHYAEVLLMQKIGDFGDTLSYQIDKNIDAKQGDLVSIPLRNRSTNGIIIDIHNKKPPFRTLAIKEVLQKELLNKNQLELIKWMAKFYYCPMHRILKLFIPKKIFSNAKLRGKKIEQEQIKESAKKTLNKEQKEVLREILNSKKNNFLIHGITGSGKTEIYVQLANHYIKENKQVLILVPEISLTPQTINYFQSALGIKAAVIHSKLAEGERIKAWKEIKNGESKIIIGSRSAIFAPFHNLKLIIVDEEHENSFKQDSSPRYKLHRLIEQIQNLEPSIKVVYASATPSIETTFKLKNSTLRLNQRIGTTKLPEIEIVDLREEFKKHNYSIFSEKLDQYLEETLKSKKQAILFINRRGAASSVVCRDCGYSEKCSDCEISLTYHPKTLNQPHLICHHCGKISKPKDLCPNCHGHNIRYLGIGTQKIESELQKRFPSAKILRADKDTTGTKHGFEEIYQNFKEGKADFLIGTQMIAKGLHLPNVDLVGVVLADIGLNIPDFRSQERNFQLMTQIAGRAGRGENPGKVVIQTYNPDNQSLIYTQNNDYENFYKLEITQRKLLKNPPFSSICKITIQNPNLNACKKESENIEELLKEYSGEKYEINSYPAYLLRIRGKYQYMILIKTLNPESQIHNLLEKLPKKYIIDPNVKIDIDPNTTT